MLNTPRETWRPYTRQGRKSGSTITRDHSCIPRRRRGEFDAVAKATEFANHLGGPTLDARFGDGRAAFLVRDAVVQDLPHEATEPMRDRSDRLGMTETDDEAAVQQLKDTAFGLHRGVRGLIEQS